MSTTGVRALFTAQTDAAVANLRWPCVAPHPTDDEVTEALRRLRSLGYSAEVFEERDGISLQGGRREAHLDDVRAAFQRLKVECIQARELEEKLIEIHTGYAALATAIVPIDKLRLEREFELGAFRFIPAVGDQPVAASNHPWGMYLLDVPGADTPNSAWRAIPGKSIEGDAGLLAYALVECRVELQAHHLVTFKVPHQEAVLRLCAERAEAGVDLLRMSLCSDLFPQYVQTWQA